MVNPSTIILIILTFIIFLALILSVRIVNTTLHVPRFGILATAAFNSACFAIWTAFWIFLWSRWDSSNLHGMSLVEILKLYRGIGLPSIVFGLLQGAYQFTGFYLWRNNERLAVRIVSGLIIASSIILLFTGLGLILLIISVVATG